MYSTELKVLDYDYASLVDFLLKESGERKTLVTYYNFNTFLLFNKNSGYIDNWKKDFFFHSDGIGTYLLSKLIFRTKLQNNVNGSNLYPLLINKLMKSNNKIFIVYSPNCKASEIERSISEYFRGSYKLVRYYILNKDNDSELLKRIIDFQPNVVFVGIGQPRQEYWVLNNQHQVKANLLVCTGSGFEYLLGLKKRAPTYIQKIGMEWLYRLLQEPKRLWKRYIFGIPIFMFNIILIKVKLLLKKEST